jgi:hypothetical protein
MLSIKLLQNSNPRMKGKWIATLGVLISEDREMVEMVSTNYQSLLAMLILALRRASVDIKKQFMHGFLNFNKKSYILWIFLIQWDLMTKNIDPVRFHYK